jgi:hypothetical protein
MEDALTGAEDVVQVGTQLIYQDERVSAWTLDLAPANRLRSISILATTFMWSWRRDRRRPSTGNQWAVQAYAMTVRLFVAVRRPDSCLRLTPWSGCPGTAPSSVDSLPVRICSSLGRWSSCRKAFPLEFRRDVVAVARKAWIRHADA